MIRLPLKIFQLPQGNNQPVLTWPCFILMWIFRRFNGLILPITYLYFHNCPLNWKSACSTIIWCLHWNQWWFRAKTCRPASQSFHGIMRVMREPWWEPLKLSCSQVLVYRQEGYIQKVEDRAMKKWHTFSSGVPLSWFIFCLLSVRISVKLCFEF